MPQNRPEKKIPPLCRSAPIGGCPPTLCRSRVEPPTGTIHPRESRGTKDRKQESTIRETPFQIRDRKGVDWRMLVVFVLIGECRSSLRRSGVEPPTLRRSGVEPPTLSRSGVEPPTGTIHPRQIPLTIPNPEKHLPEKDLSIDSHFLSVDSPALAWMDHSGRGFNPRPAQESPKPPKPQPAKKN